MFRRAPSRGGRGRRAAVDLVVCFGCGGISRFFVCFLLRTHAACCKYEAALRFTSLVVLRTNFQPRYRGDHAEIISNCLRFSFCALREESFPDFRDTLLLSRDKNKSLLNWDTRGAEIRAVFLACSCTPLLYLVPGYATIMFECMAYNAANNVPR